MSNILKIILSTVLFLNFSNIYSHICLDHKECQQILKYKCTSKKIPVCLNNSCYCVECSNKKCFPKCRNNNDCHGLKCPAKQENVCINEHCDCIYKLEEIENMENEDI